MSASFIFSRRWLLSIMMIDDHDDDDKAEKIASYECFLHLFEEVVFMMMIYEDEDDYDNDFSLMIMMTTITTTSMSASFTSWRRLFYFLVFLLRSCLYHFTCRDAVCRCKCGWCGGQNIHDNTQIVKYIHYDDASIVVLIARCLSIQVFFTRAAWSSLSLLARNKKTMRENLHKIFEINLTK